MLNFCKKTVAHNYGLFYFKTIVMSVVTDMTEVAVMLYRDINFT